MTPMKLRVLEATVLFVATYTALMTILFFWGADPVERNVNP